jgi:hypothetical protein
VGYGQESENEDLYFWEFPLILKIISQSGKNILKNIK